MHRISDDVPELVREIKQERFVGNVGREYDVVGYTLPQLKNIRTYLLDGREHKNKSLIRCIEREIEYREKKNRRPAVESKEPPMWFVEMWYAVLSLFNKGLWERGNENATRILNDIKDDWKINNGYGAK